MQLILSYLVNSSQYLTVSKSKGAVMVVIV